MTEYLVVSFIVAFFKHVGAVKNHHDVMAK